MANTEQMFRIKNKEIILYGAASIGNLAFDWFEDAGFHVAGYIDKRGNEIDSLRGRPVYSLSDEKVESFKNSNRYAVFVSVKNVFEHSNIANLLIKEGFCNIIYRSINVINGVGNKEQNQLYEVYDLISNGKIKNLDKDIPMTCTLDIHQPISDYVLSREENEIVTMVSIDSLHTDRKVRKTPWFDKPVFSLLPHIDFFHYLNGKEGVSYNRYMEYCISGAGGKIDTTESWKMNVIKNRSCIYEHMKQSLELESGFFVRNAPNVEWHADKGVFNLQSGKHRAAFFASLGRHYIPLRMKKEDYIDYLNFEVASELLKLLADREVTQLCGPIGHPLFFDYPCENKGFYYGFLYKLYYHISAYLYESSGRLEFERITIYCSLDDYGFIERTIRKSGCNIDLSISKEDMKLMQILDKLLYCDLLEHIENDLVNKNYDYIILDVRKDNNCEKLKKIKDIKECLIILNTNSQQECFLKKNYKTDYFFRGIADGLDTCVMKIS